MQCFWLQLRRLRNKDCYKIIRNAPGDGCICLMRPADFEFRYRFWIILSVYVLGFAAPWDALLPLDGQGVNAHVWGKLAVGLAKGLGVETGTAFSIVLAAGIVCAVAGAWLRTWGSAYLGASVVGDTQMRGESVVADGPYRYVRNPLYLGTWLNLAALALLMRPSGAVFATLLVVGLQLRLILGEEAFLAGKLGEEYAAYCARVPRLLPALRPQVPASGLRPRWGQAARMEVFMWGTAGSFAALGWEFNVLLLLRCVVVSLGAALVMRGLGMSEGRGV